VEISGNPLTTDARPTRENPVNTMTGHDLPNEMRASDADRDAVVAALSEHFQAGRLTQAELDDRIGQALTSRTWGELRKLLADLPATGSGPQIPSGRSADAHPLPSSGRVATPLVAALTSLAIAALVLIVLQSGWGLIWLAIPALIIARKLRH
jgi:hypothetical protein